MNYIKDMTEGYDFRDIALMTESPVILRATDHSDNEDYFVLDVVDVDGLSNSVALTTEALTELALEIQEIINEKAQDN